MTFDTNGFFLRSKREMAKLIPDPRYLNKWPSNAAYLSQVLALSCRGR